MDNYKLSVSVANLIGLRRVVILGYGIEGKSTLKFLRSLLPDLRITLADRNFDIAKFSELEGLNLILGHDYLNAIVKGDFVFKTPGISLKDFQLPEDVILSSQTDLFLRLFGNQVVGITGTKGKSTTSSLLYHILKSEFDSVFLVGNIGVPALDIAFDIKLNSLIVYEMSSHQLEFLTASPKIAVLLNLHQEHLDHYQDYAGYRNAKWQIASYQDSTDYFIFNSADSTIEMDMVGKDLKGKKLPVSLEYGPHSIMWFDGTDLWFQKERLLFSRKDFKLRGNHNIFNLMVCLLASNKIGVDFEKGIQAAYTFKGLHHRLEYIGKFQGIDFYNDSIATIPEAAINAIKAVEEVSTVILGGFDRQIDYTPLIDFLVSYRKLNLILLGAVGIRLAAYLLENNYVGNVISAQNLSDAVGHAFQLSPKGTACLLSPAAASYDSFRNFEDRGDQFKSLVMNFGNESAF